MGGARGEGGSQCLILDLAEGWSDAHYVVAALINIMVNVIVISKCYILI